MTMTLNRWVLLAAPALLLGLPMMSFAQDTGHDEVRKKLDAIRKQISELREREKALLEQEKVILKIKAEREREAQLKEAERKVKEHAEQIKREIAEKAKHYIKVEIRGKLLGVNQAHPAAGIYLFTGDVTWPLSFQDAKGLNKALLAECGKLANKHVVLTGSITTKISPNWSYPPGNAWEERMRDRDRWNPYMPRVPINPTVIVESIKLAP